MISELIVAIRAVPLDDPPTLAVTLAAAGMSTVSPYLTAQRRREIGIRMTLGAGMLMVAVIAASGPAWRAALSDPVKALRQRD